MTNSNRSVLFCTHEDFSRTSVAKAMLYDVAKYLKENQNYDVGLLSAGSINVFASEDNEFYFKRSEFGVVDSKQVFYLLAVFFRITKLFLRYNIIWFRSYPMMILFALPARLIGRKIVFDTRGLWFDELVDSGKLKRIPRSLFRLVELVLLKLSHRVVCVTKAQSDYYQGLYKLKERKKFVVVPNGAKVCSVSDAREEGVLRFVYVGSLIKWHSPEIVRDFMRALQYRGINSSLDVITRDIDKANNLFCGIDNLSIYSHDYRSKPIRFDFGFCFITGGISKDICFPVKFAEYLVALTPVIAFDNVSVVNEIIGKYGFGYCFSKKMDIDSIVDDFLENIGEKSPQTVFLPEELSFKKQLHLVEDILRVVA
jgi:glycosyltransferase involved in cell wall biosynthesis